MSFTAPRWWIFLVVVNGQAATVRMRFMYYGLQIEPIILLLRRLVFFSCYKRSLFPMRISSTYTVCNIFSRVTRFLIGRRIVVRRIGSSEGNATIDLNTNEATKTNLLSCMVHSLRQTTRLDIH